MSCRGCSLVALALAGFVVGGGCSRPDEDEHAAREQALLACQSPFGGAARAIPGTIQAEDYDVGGQGCAYNDTTAGNNWNHYRADGVDLQPSTGGNEPGTNIGLTATGEYVRYTVNVAAAGPYRLELRVAATATGRSLDVSMEGTLIADNLAIPNTGSYQSYQTISKDVTLAAGLQSLQVLFNTGSQNLTWIRFTSLGCTPESDAAFCGRLGKACGPVTAPDNCGVSRTVASCGTCAAPAGCTATGVCCTPESDAGFCSRLGKTCGAVSGTDNCGAARSVPSCGPCEPPGICTAANVCCAGESDAAFCARLGKTCGPVTANDLCGISRTTDCGMCAAPASCTAANVCCSPESDAAFCSRLGKTCGAVTAADNCGGSRTAACGTCTAPSACSASNVCVAPGGCLRTVPVSTSAALATAVAAALPGDCIVLANGNYSFPALDKAGTADAPITIKALNRGMAVVNSGVIHFLGAAHVVVEGLDVTSNGLANSGTFFNAGSSGMLIAFTDSSHCRLTRSRIRPAGAVSNRDWIVLTGALTHYNRIDHNDLGPQALVANMIVIDGTGQEEPLVPGNVSQHNQIDHNYFHDIAYSGGNNWEAVRVGRSWQGPTAGFNVIEYNLFNKAHSDPETVSLKSSDNVVRHNTMRATNGEITLRHGNRNQVYGNYILGVSGSDASSGSKGIRVYGADHRIFNNYIHVNGTGILLDAGSSNKTDEPGKEHYQVYRAWVYHNTVIGKTIKFGGSKTYDPRDCRAANNIAGSLSVDSGATVVQEGNTIGNPLTLQSGIYRNTGGSRNNAVNSAFYGLADDIDGQARSSPDRGADEQSTAPVLTPGPLTTAQVGPAAP